MNAGAWVMIDQTFLAYSRYYLPIFDLHVCGVCVFVYEVRTWVREVSTCHFITNSVWLNNSVLSFYVHFIVFLNIRNCCFSQVCIIVIWASLEFRLFVGQNDQIEVVTYCRAPRNYNRQFCRLKHHSINQNNHRNYMVIKDH